ncbi:hypothetical protein [Desulfospira joergensenii]|uniref:hypothetical protein n=1 Tax=Desulfospira joergensenii TaxID=53329 RepID=UPI0003B5BF8F|nr:hypothetical protein [Desulfospira joergensenii]
MEDISRELEREIARAKPAEHKRSRKKRILIVDDFGGMKSGGYLRVLVKFLWVSSVVCALIAGGLYFFYAHLSGENRVLAEKVTVLEKKYKRLVEEKEVLMARLVISGKEPRVEPGSKDRKAVPKNGKKEPSSEELKQKIAAVTPVKDPTPSAVSKSNEKKIEAAPGKKKIAAVQNQQPKVQAEPEKIQAQKTETDPGPSGKSLINSVAVEKFSITRDKLDKHLLVGFDIRNVSEKPGGVSGRIFTVLKPEITGPENWLVVPTVPLKDGIPSLHRKGQYFSIAHFKPVRFRIENGKSPDYYKKAAVYIFDEQGKLISESFIDILPEETDQN